MLGRKTYGRDELDSARAAVEQQLSAYRRLAEAIGGGEGSGADGASRTALEELEAVLFTSLTLALDRRFVHRVRLVTGTDTNPLTEVELICASLMGGGVFREDTVIRYVPASSVLGLRTGDRIRLTADDFARLSEAFLVELEKRFVEPG